ncbi:MAG: hypothetical protein HN413_07940 [Chloroflexi bacterium]|jgi:hypothetical protein|nr:hypothetical protein [Chloroflexota bacterium]
MATLVCDGVVRELSAPVFYAPGRFALKEQVMKGRYFFILLLVVASFAFSPLQDAQPEAPIEWMSLVNQILSVVVTFVVATLLPRLFRIADKYLQRLEAQIGETNMNRAYVVIENAVRAAEQLGITEQIKNKRDFAFDKIERELYQAGIEMDLSDIYENIESMVNKLFPKRAA